MILTRMKFHDNCTQSDSNNDLNDVYRYFLMTIDVDLL